MKSATIKEVLDQPHDALIMSVSGVLEAVYPPKPVGTNTAQDAMLSDGTGKIKCTFWNRDNISSAKGKRVILNCVHGQKGWSGVQRKASPDKTVAGKIWHSLSISEKADMLDPSQLPSEPQNTPAIAQNAPQKRLEPSALPLNGQTVGMAINNACQFLMHSGEPFSPIKIKEVALSIIGVAKEIETGGVPEPKSSPKTCPECQTTTRTDGTCPNMDCSQGTPEF